MKVKTCIKCNKRKILSKFVKNKNKCKECESAYMKEYRKTRIDDRDRTKYRKEYYAKNKDRFSKWHKEWRKKNDRSQYHKEYLDKNPSAKIACCCRNRIRNCIQKGWKSQSSLSLTGCNSWNELKQYLENKFQKGMTWDNYGEWHIDHIKPCSSFDLTDTSEQKKCFHYTNLQPLWAIDNLSKSDTI